MIKWLNSQQRHNNPLDVHVPSNRATKYMRQKRIELPKSNKVINHYIWTYHFSVRLCRQKISKDIVDLSSTINHPDITGIYKTLQLATAEHTFYTHTHTHPLKISQSV